jgi:hypothetical protein
MLEHWKGGDINSDGRYPRRVVSRKGLRQAVARDRPLLGRLRVYANVSWSVWSGHEARDHFQEVLLVRRATRPTTDAAWREALELRSVWISFPGVLHVSSKLARSKYIAAPRESQEGDLIWLSRFRERQELHFDRL